jgi:hypothetical protein
MGTAIALEKPVKIAAQTVDDFGDVCKLRDEFAPTERLYNRLREQLKDLVADADPDAEFLVRGERYTLRISARSIQRKVDVEKVKKLLGAAKFLEAATVTLTALSNFLTKPQIETVVFEEQSGSRSFDPIPLARDV